MSGRQRGERLLHRVVLRILNAGYRLRDRRRYLLQLIFADGRAQAGHQTLVKSEIMQRQKVARRDLPREVQMPEVCARKGAAAVAVARLVGRPRVARVLGAPADEACD